MNPPSRRGKKRSFEVAGKMYKNKKEAANYWKAIVHRNSGRNVEADEAEFMTDAIEKMPEFADQTVEAVFVEKDPEYKNWAVYVILRCATGLTSRHGPVGREKALNAARGETPLGFEEQKRIKKARNAVWPQVASFRNQSDELCFVEGCGSTGPFEIDHFETMFCEIYKDFVGGNPDATFRNDCPCLLPWMNFHLDKCKLQKLCKACHEKKTAGEARQRFAS